jgi:hypothetical protein
MAGREDPIKFVKAEDFFNAMNSTNSGWNSPKEVVNISSKPPKDLDPDNPNAADYYHGVTVTFDDETLCVMQFIRPTAFRVRYDPAVRNSDEYGDENRCVLRSGSSRNFTALLMMNAQPSNPARLHHQARQGVGRLQKHQVEDGTPHGDGEGYQGGRLLGAAGM